MSFDVNLLRHVSVLDARVEKLEVAGKEIPPRQVVSTATTGEGQSQGRTSVFAFCL